VTGDRGRPSVVLCDADGCLFPSEEPAYEASAEVTARFLDGLGVAQDYPADRLRREFTGMNFRATAAELARRHGVEVSAEVLDHWVRLERDVVTRHLASVLRPDPEVVEPLTRLSGAVHLAVVSSSAGPRIDTCLLATGLAPLFATADRFSAESLRPPVGKPHPGVYLDALRRLQVAAEDAVAVEDSAVGVRAAAAARIPVVGLLRFVPAAEVEDRRCALLGAGATYVVDTWEAVVDLVGELAQLVRDGGIQRLGSG
jgi:HAD superfamily hydrolase (TIGR01509 family)